MTEPALYPETKRKPGRPKTLKPADPVVEPPAVADFIPETDPHPLPMDTAPRDGRPLWLTDGSAWARAAWRKTRTFDKAARRFVPGGFFVHEFTVNRIGFKPVGWEPIVN